MNDLSKMEFDARGGEETAPIPFGRWVLEQTARGGFVGQIATIAKSDRGFPKDGNADAVRKRLGDTGADPEMFDAVDDAELDYLAL